MDAKDANVGSSQVREHFLMKDACLILKDSRPELASKASAMACVPLWSIAFPLKSSLLKVVFICNGH